MKRVTLGSGAAALAIAAAAGAAEAQPREVPLAPASERNSAAEVNSMDMVQRSDREAAMDDVSELLGRGVRGLDMRQRGVCLDGSMVLPAPGSSTIDYDVKLLNSSAEFEQETMVSASVDAEFADWSGGVKASMATDSRNRTESKYLFVRLTVEQEPGVNAHRLRPAAGIPSDRARFFEVCGDRYISRVKLGGELVAVLRYQFDSADQKSNFTASMSAGGFGVSSSAQLQQKLSSSTAYSDLSVRVHRSGASGNAPETTVPALLAAAQSFPTEVAKTNANVVSFETRDYATLQIDAAGDYSDTWEAVRRMDRAIGRSEPIYRPDGVYFIRTGGAPTRITPQQLLDTVKRLKALRAACVKAPWNSCEVPDDLANFDPIVPESN